MKRRGVLIEWTSETLPGGCVFISVQLFDEAYEKRFELNDVVPIAAARQKRGRKA